jgi:hypothetical protein
VSCPASSTVNASSRSWSVMTSGAGGLRVEQH